MAGAGRGGAPAARSPTGVKLGGSDVHAQHVRRDVEEYLRASGAEDVLASTMRALEAARPRNAAAFIARFVQDNFAVAVAPSLLGLDPPAHGIPPPVGGDGSDSDTSADGSARYPAPPASFFARGGRRRKARRHAVSGPPRSVGLDLDGPSLAAAALSRPVSQLGLLLADGAASGDDSLSDALLDLEADRHSSERVAVGAGAGAGRGGGGGAAGGLAARPGSPGPSLSASLEALTPSGSARDASTTGLLERALALERAGALSGAEWPFEASVAASAVTIASYATGETVGAPAAAAGTPSTGRGDAVTMVAVLRGRLRQAGEAPGSDSASAAPPTAVLQAGDCLSAAALCLRPASGGPVRGSDQAAAVSESPSLPQLVAAEPSRVVEARGDAVGAALGAAWRRRLERRIAVLGAVGLLRKLLRPAEIARLASGCSERRVRPGELAAAQGRPALGLLVVLRGTVVLVVDLALAFEGCPGIRPERVRVATLREGSVVGADAALRPRGWLADVLAWPEELDMASEVSIRASSQRDALTGAVEGAAVPEAAQAGGLPASARSASLDCILLDVPRAAIEAVCGETLLSRAQHADPALFAEEMGRLA